MNLSRIVALSSTVLLTLALSQAAHAKIRLVSEQQETPSASQSIDAHAKRTSFAEFLKNLRRWTQQETAIRPLPSSPEK